MKIFILISLLLWNNVALTKENSNKILKYSLVQHEEPINLKEIEFFDPENNPHALSEYEGTPIIMHFWATWCTFCINNMKDLDKLNQKLQNEKKEYHIISLSVDYNESIILKNFFAQHNIKYLNAYTDRKNNIYNSLKITTIPTTLILNKMGREVVRINGFIDWLRDEAFTSLLAKYQHN